MSPLKVTSLNPAAPPKVTSLNPAASLKVALSNLAASLKVAPSNLASPLKVVAPSNRQPLISGSFILPTRGSDEDPVKESARDGYPACVDLAGFANQHPYGGATTGIE